MALAARSAAMRSAFSPSSRSTSSVCCPRAGGALRSTGGVADRRSGLATPVMCVMPSPASPCLPARQRYGQAACLDLSVVKRLGNGVDGAAGHGLVFQQRNPVGRGARAGHGLHGGDERLRGASRAACWWQSARRWPIGVAQPLRKSAANCPSLPMASSMLPSCVGKSW